MMHGNNDHERVKIQRPTAYPRYNENRDGLNIDAAPQMVAAPMVEAIAELQQLPS
jgi:hypothetical protein